MSTSERCEVVIIGTGILGCFLAVLLSRQGKKVIVIGAPDRYDLSADTLRNHAWLQSGLLYGEEATWAAAQAMFNSGNLLFHLAGLPRPATRGVFRLMRLQERAFLEKAERLNIPVQKLSEVVATDLIGLFFLPGYEHFSVPDTLFDEARVLNALIHKAMLNGADFRKATVRLEEDRFARNGYVVIHDQGVIEADATIMCAGAGSIPLLDGLGLPHPLKTFQSPLLVLRCGIALRTPLLVDVAEGAPTAGLAVGQHYGIDGYSSRCVIGNRDREPLMAEDVMGDRFVSDALSIRLKALVPEPLQFLLNEHSGHYRITVGYKTEAVDRNGKASINPWFMTWPGRYPGLAAAIPGKATLAPMTAIRILGELGLLSDADPCGNKKSTNNEPKFHEDVQMHHAQAFDGILNEVKKKNSK